MSKIYYDYVVYGDMNEPAIDWNHYYSYVPAIKPFQVIHRSMYEGRHYPAPREKVLNEEFIVAGPFLHKDVQKAHHICNELNEQWREKNKYTLQKHGLYDPPQKLPPNDGRVGWKVIECKSIAVFNGRKINIR